MERRLAAILSADVQGYSRLMGEDEIATIRTLTGHRGVMAQLIGQYRGRVVDAAGDNLLAEFASVVEAVQCAVAMQRALAARNAALPAHRQMTFRIGINLGDVVAEQERLYGDDVNLAARLEGLAEAGGICISGTVYDQIETKLNLRYVYLGERVVKNMARPVRVYRIQPGSEPPSAGWRATWHRKFTPWQRVVLVTAIVLLLLLTAVACWQVMQRVALAPAEAAAMAQTHLLRWC
jgi:class 3 adenylate cyclase